MRPCPTPQEVQASCETDPVTDPRVFVLAKNAQTTLMPCHPARARAFLANGRAVIHRIIPLVLRLKDRQAGSTQPTQIKIDPSAKTTGVSILTTSQNNDQILFQIEISHRKAPVQKKMGQRRGYRRRRRSTNLRCRKPRFNNRGKKGFIAPSIQSILHNTESWVSRLRRWAPISEIVLETSKFDAAKLQDAEISGSEYQEGTLFGYEAWEYLLARFDHKCVYCGKGERPLTKNHIVPKCAGGSNRISNLTVACVPCNRTKGKHPLTVFLKNNPEKLKALRGQLKKPLASCATMNILRNRIAQIAESTGLPATFSSGAETKWNRSRFHVPKTHSLDAAMCGPMTERPKGVGMRPLLIQATGRGSYCRTRTDAYGFPRLYLPRIKMIHGFQTGDIVRTPKGVGRIAVRSSGHFSLAGKGTVKQTNCRLAQRADGYNYSPKPAIGVSGNNPLL